MGYKRISQEEISAFMNGRDPQERIVNITYDYADDFCRVFYRDKNDNKCVSKEKFYPFVWATGLACSKLCNGDRAQVKKLLSKYHISVKKLSNVNYKGEVVKQFESGYMFMFFATEPMTSTNFQMFFKEAGNPIYKKNKSDNSSNDDYLIVPPIEQFMIQTGKRFFKGYDDYDEVLRMIFDLETEGLNPRKDRLKLNGVRLNRPVVINGKTYGTEEKPWQRVFRVEGETDEEKNKSELDVIETMVKLIYTFRPDIITAHNGENFDWNFLIVRAEMCGSSMEEISKKYFGKNFIRKDYKESVLKLGGEIETFRRTIVPYTTITDSLHAVRRAQATNSNFKEATLKYSTKFLGLKKENRVYTPGNEIDNILTDKVHKYAFNNKNGDWYIYDEQYIPEKQEDIEFKTGKDGDKPFIAYTRNYLKDGYEIVTGEYIINRYLMDDLWECDKVEYTLNVADFMLAKFLPVTYSKCTTMGTAGQWKSLMLAWSYEKGLAIPNLPNKKLSVGGLSRLLLVGFVSNVIKLDYNSLYPSIILTWGLTTFKDLSNVMLSLLEYVLTNREKYKKIKKGAEKVIDKYELMVSDIKLTQEQINEYELNKSIFKKNDNLQAVVKKMGNSNFGAVSAAITSIFQWADVEMGGQITCIGRQCLRLMISHFEKLGYRTIVGDSFTGDTPLYIKYDGSGLIDIKPISELINEQKISIDPLGREYDYSNKPYKVLCRSGWVKPSYIYRHKTDKAIYEVADNERGMKIGVTEDHSLFNSEREKIKPNEISKDTELEYYNNDILPDAISKVSSDGVKQLAIGLSSGKINRVPIEILNASHSDKQLFYATFIKNYNEDIKYSKTCIAGLQYILKK